MIGVDEVRRLRAFLGTTAGEGGWRVVIVDRADELNQNAANALLKALEEPPPRTLFLLISSAEGRLPVTIRSRTRTLRVVGFGRGGFEEGSACGARARRAGGRRQDARDSARVQPGKRTPRARACLERGHRALRARSPPASPRCRDRRCAAASPGRAARPARPIPSGSTSILLCCLG